MKLLNFGSKGQQAISVINDPFAEESVNQINIT
jgi:hypothetical protein